MPTEDTIAAAAETRAHELSTLIREKARELGYAACGFASVDDFADYREQLLAREGFGRFQAGGLVASTNLADTVPEAKSIICLVQAFDDIAFPEALTGRIARAYQSRLYGGVKRGVNSPEHVAMMDYLAELGIGTFPADGFLQVPDRPAASRAGVITFGQNNFAYAGEHGSFIILTSILVDTALDCENHEPKRPCPPDCRLCIDACPTRAMDEEGHINPEKCILYNNMFPDALLTHDIRALQGECFHGCDACQAVCPRNAAALSHMLPENGARKDPLLERLAENFDFERILTMDDDFYRNILHPVISPYHDVPARHRRNAAIALGNSADPSHLSALQKAAAEDPDEEVRNAATWAVAHLQETVVATD